MLPVFPTLPPLVGQQDIRRKDTERAAAAADTHLFTREHEDQPKEKREFQQREPKPLPEDSYDQARLGVRPLIDFLQQFLKSIQTAAKPTPPAGADTGRAAQAVSAYQQRSQYHDDHKLQIPPAEANGLLHTGEIRQIHRLIDQLQNLERRGILEITLAKADTFLNSIEAAIAANTVIKDASV
jgi:hypothetical protein